MDNWKRATYFHRGPLQKTKPATRKRNKKKPNKQTKKKSFSEKERRNSSLWSWLLISLQWQAATAATHATGIHKCQNNNNQDFSSIIFWSFLMDGACVLFISFFFFSQISLSFSNLSFKSFFALLCFVFSLIVVVVVAAAVFNFLLVVLRKSFTATQGQFEVKLRVNLRWAKGQFEVN